MKARGFGFVEFEDVGDAADAIDNMNGVCVCPLVPRFLSLPRHLCRPGAWPRACHTVALSIMRVMWCCIRPFAAPSLRLRVFRAGYHSELCPGDHNQAWGCQAHLGGRGRVRADQSRIARGGSQRRAKFSSRWCIGTTATPSPCANSRKLRAGSCHLLANVGRCPARPPPHACNQFMMMHL